MREDEVKEIVKNTFAEYGKPCRLAYIEGHNKIVIETDDGVNFKVTRGAAPKTLIDCYTGEQR